MIRIFGVNETTGDLDSKNGDVVLIASKAVLHKYENGDFSVDLEASRDYEEYFEQGRIVVVDDQNGEREYFRMNDIVKTRNKCTCKCPHISNDLKCRVQPATAAVSFSAIQFYEALHGINSTFGMIGHSDFDILNYSTQYNDFPQREFNNLDNLGMSMYDIVQSLIKAYGGFFIRKRRGYGISKDRITNDYGVQIRYGKNLKNITKTEDWSRVCTRMVAIGNSNYSKTFNSDLYPNTIPYDYVRTVIFEQPNIKSEDYQTSAAYYNAVIADLTTRANAYFSVYSAPSVNYTVDAYIEKSIDGVHLDVRDIGDQIEVIDETIGINLMTTVLGFDYDLNLKKYNSIQFGNYQKSMRGYNELIESRIKESQGDITTIAYPVNSIYQNSGQNPNDVGIKGYWQLLSSSGGVYTWQRIS